MTFWVSFCDPDKPQGQKFLGACLVEGDTLVEAIEEARRLGINPGGEALGVVGDPETVKIIPDHWKNRLLTKAECDKMDKEVLALQEANGVPVPHEPEQQFVCKEHNGR
jgi:hypothetical protein